MYTLQWIPSALDDLADIWVHAEAAQRNDITIATDQIDQRLRMYPSGEGESREEGRRILLIPPLGVKYVVSEEDRLVRVLSVWRFTTPSR